MLTLKLNNLFFKLIVCCLIGTFLALALLLLFSLLSSLIGASSIAIKIFKLIIRLFAVALSTFLFVQNSRGILFGGLAGLTTGVLVQLLFVIFSHSFNLSSFLLNLLFCVIFGIIFGIIFVNLKNMRDYSWKNSKNGI